MKIYLLTLLMISISGFSSASERYIRIDSPASDGNVNPARPVTVAGSGKGLFEGNVVVRIETIDGEKLVEVATTMHRENIAAAGTWQTLITVPQPAPDTIRLIAYSPSPREGDAAITSKPVVLRIIGSALEKRDWHLHRYLGESGKMSPVQAGTTIDAGFNEGRISGSAGCNRYFAPYHSGADNHLKLTSATRSTQMACPPAVSDQEKRYLTLLSSVTSWQRQNESLLLFDKEQHNILQFVAAEPTTLERTQWQAGGINNGRGGVVTGHNTRLATAMFIDGEISGNAGCNRFSASYEINGKKITIGPAMTTRKHCAEPDGVMEQEQQYLNALARARTCNVIQNELELRDGNGSLQIRFHVQKQ